MKRTLAMMALLVFLTGCSRQQSIWFQGDFEAALAQAKAQGKHIVIDFYSPT